MASDRLRDLTARLRRFTSERGWSRFHDPKNLAMLVASEAGELLHLFRWVRNDEADAFARSPASRRGIEEEIADVAIGVLLLADRIGADLAAIVESKIALNAEKYPVGRRLTPRRELRPASASARGGAAGAARASSGARAGRPARGERRLAGGRRRR